MFYTENNFLKSILSEIISMVMTSTLEYIFANFLFLLFDVTSEMIIAIPIYRVTIALSIYLILFLLTKLINIFKVNIPILDSMNSKSKILLIINALLIVVVLGMQFYLITFYSNTMPLFITIINIIGLIAYFSVSIYSIINSSKLEITQRDFTKCKSYNSFSNNFT